MTDQGKTALRAPVADERAAFEAAWRELNSPWPMNSRMHDDGRYATPDIEREWRLWQARAALASAPVAVRLPPRESENCGSSSAIAYAMAYNKALDDVAALNASAPVAEKAVAALIRERQYLGKGIDGREFYGDFSEWFPASLNYAKSVTAPGRNARGTWQVRWLVDAAPQASAAPVAFSKDGVLFWYGDHAARRGFNGDLYLAPQAREPGHGTEHAAHGLGDVVLPRLPPITHEWAALISDSMAKALENWARAYTRTAILADRQQRAGNADEYEKMRDVLQWIVDDAASGGVAKLRPQQEKRARAALSAQPAQKEQSDE